MTTWDPSPGETGGDRASVHHLDVPRSARYALLGEPGPSVDEILVVLHGYRQLAPRFIRRFRPVARPGRLIAAPEALNRFYLGDPSGRHGPESRVGGTWMTREDREAEIEDYVRYLDLLAESLVGRCGGEGARPVLRGLGFSQGAHTLARWSVLGRTPLTEVIFWGEVWPPDLPGEEARKAWRGVRLVSVQGREDAHLGQDFVARQSDRARELGVEVGLRWHSGGHEIDRETLRAVVDGDPGTSDGEPDLR